MNNESSNNAIRGNDQTLNKDGAINIACHNLVMPGRTLMLADHKQIGGPYRIPYSQTYDPVTFTFYGDRNLNARRYFDIWQTAVININDNSINFWNEYTADIEIAQLDKKGEKTYVVTLYEAYPFAVGDVPYAYASTHQVQDVSVSIQYRIWRANHDTTTILGAVKK